MTDSPEPAGEAVPKQPSIILDAVAGYFHRRAKSAEDEALGLAVTVRSLAAENDALRARIAELECKDAE